MVRDHYIELVGKVITVLESMRDAPAGLSLQELANRTGYVKSSLHRILQSLKHHGYVDQDAPGAKYRLGLPVLALARSLGVRGELVTCARPFLLELVKAYNECAYLAVMRRGRGVFLDIEESHRDFRLVGPMFNEVYFHATAAGKAMAAFFPPPLQQELLESGPLMSLTSQTITDPARVAEEWAEIRQAGYAINDEETLLGAVFLAGPVFDSRVTICGSVSIGIPKARFSVRLKDQMANGLKSACSRLTAQLESLGYVHTAGFQPSDPA